jgi:BirA family biotin operon repressor/biotin-[acetyl-CoA-carboxylase] ligase
MSDQIPLDQWVAHLRADVRNVSGGTSGRILVLDETDSTQDAARRLNPSPRPGDVVIAGRQTNGRGRCGRSWLSAGEDGVTMTVVMSREAPDGGGRLAIAAGLAAARAIEAAASNCALNVRLKWPNDVMVGHRKVGGILVEQVDDVALVGIGINIHQTHFPAELSPRAVSLAQLGVQVDRLAVILHVLRALDQAAHLPMSALAEEFLARDCLRGCAVTVLCGGRTVAGVIERLDPFDGLTMTLVDGSRTWLAAGLVTILDWRLACSPLPTSNACR